MEKKCYLCGRRKVFDYLGRLICDKCFVRVVEKRVKKSLGRVFSKGDEVLVVGGLAAYFNMDPVLIRLIVVLLALLTSGVGVLVYVLLWIIVPKALTTTQRLEMKGEEVTVKNIEKFFKDCTGKRRSDLVGCAYKQDRGHISLLVLRLFSLKSNGKANYVCGMMSQRPAGINSVSPRSFNSCKVSIEIE